MTPEEVGDRLAAAARRRGCRRQRVRRRRGPRPRHRRRAAGPLVGRGPGGPGRRPRWAATSSTGSPPSTSWPAASRWSRTSGRPAAGTGCCCAPGCRARTPVVRVGRRPAIPGAAWHERETHEMFGIDFARHPRPVAAAAAARVRGPPAAQGVRAGVPGGEAVAGREGAGGVRGRRGRSGPPIRPPGVPDPNEWGPARHGDAGCPARAPARAADPPRPPAPAPASGPERGA